MKRRLIAGVSALVLALGLTACGQPQQRMCTDRNGTQYVCDDDDDNGGFIIFPWMHHPSTPRYNKPAPKVPLYKAPTFKAPAYKAPSYKAPSYRSSGGSSYRAPSFRSK